MKKSINAIKLCSMPKARASFVSKTDSLWSSYRKVIEKVFPFSDLPEVFPGKKALEEGVTELKSGDGIAEASIAMSNFLFRKVIPSGGSGHLDNYLEKMSKAEAEVPLQEKMDTWYRAADEVVNKYFPIGWDRKYDDECASFRTNDSAPLNPGEESAREKVEEEWSYEEWVELHRSGKGPAISKDRRVKVIREGGKVRVVTIADGFQAVLGPLHKTIHGILKETRWLLSNEPTASGLVSKGGGREGPGVYVSGDYEAATDNLKMWRSRYLLRLLQRRSSWIPPWVWDEARGRFEEGLLFGEEKVDGVKVRKSAIRRTGQLMGDYLSFPLLCLSNLTALRVALGSPMADSLEDDGFLQINGDDIVFRVADSEIAERWMAGVQRAGLVLSRGKTLVHKRFFTINSHMFVGSSRRTKLGGRRGHVTMVPVVRSKTFFSSWSKDEGPEAVWGRWSRIRYDAGSRCRDEAGRLFLSRYTVALRKGVGSNVPFSGPRTMRTVREYVEKTRDGGGRFPRRWRGAVSYLLQFGYGIGMDLGMEDWEEGMDDGDWKPPPPDLPTLNLRRGKGLGKFSAESNLGVAWGRKTMAEKKRTGVYREPTLAPIARRKVLGVSMEAWKRRPANFPVIRSTLGRRGLGWSRADETNLWGPWGEVAAAGLQGVPVIFDGGRWHRILRRVYLASVKLRGINQSEGKIFAGYNHAAPSVPFRKFYLPTAKSLGSSLRIGNGDGGDCGESGGGAVRYEADPEPTTALDVEAGLRAWLWWLELKKGPKWCKENLEASRPGSSL